jgi:uncharacterized membrane protein
LQRLRDAVDVLQRKATPEEVDEYRHFVLMLAEMVANAHREDGVSVSPAEQAAIDEISASLGGAGGAGGTGGNGGGTGNGGGGGA